MSSVRGRPPVSFSVCPFKTKTKQRIARDIEIFRLFHIVGVTSRLGHQFFFSVLVFTGVQRCIHGLLSLSPLSPLCRGHVPAYPPCIPPGRAAPDRSSGSLLAAVNLHAPLQLRRRSAAARRDPGWIRSRSSLRATRTRLPPASSGKISARGRCCSPRSPPWCSCGCCGPRRAARSCCGRSTRPRRRARCARPSSAASGGGAAARPCSARSRMPTDAPPRTAVAMSPPQSPLSPHVRPAAGAAPPTPWARRLAQVLRRG